MAAKLREATYAGTAAEVFAALEAVVHRLGMHVERANPQAGSLRFKSGVSALSWGEDLDALVQPAGPGTVRVQIRSGLKFGMVDWGRNNKNLDRVFAELEAQLVGGPGAVPPAGQTLPPPPPPSQTAPPVPTPPPAYGSTPLQPGWHADPTGRHAERLWDGERWTAHVRDGEVVGVDPMDGPPIG